MKKDEMKHVQWLIVSHYYCHSCCCCCCWVNQEEEEAEKKKTQLGIWFFVVCLQAALEKDANSLAKCNDSHSKAGRGRKGASLSLDWLHERCTEWDVLSVWLTDWHALSMASLTFLYNSHLAFNSFSFLPSSCSAAPTQFLPLKVVGKTTIWVMERICIRQRWQT